MKTQIFHLTLEGLDTDFGPSSSTPVKITIEGDLYWGREEIQECKEMIASYFEVFPNHIRTDAEEQKNADDLDKHIDEQIKRYNETTK